MPVSSWLASAVGFSALFFAFHANQVNFSALMNLQSSFLWQVAPTFVACCYSDYFTACPLLLGQGVGIIATIILELGSSLGSHHVPPSGMWGLLLNLAVLVSVREAVILYMHASMYLAKQAHVYPFNMHTSVFVLGCLSVHCAR